jgi:uncharacterized C2H2 Zn-finger protein
MFDEIGENPSMSVSKLNEIRAQYELESITEAIEEEMLVENYEETIESIHEEILEPEIIEEYIFEEEDTEPEQQQENETKSCSKRPLDKTDGDKLFNFKCHECDEEFAKMQLLTAHCKSAHNTKPQIECVCGKKLSTWKRLLEHKAKHFQNDENSGFTCVQCNLNYKTLQAYEKHKEKKHGENAEKFICSRELLCDCYEYL